MNLDQLRETLRPAVEDRGITKVAESARVSAQAVHQWINGKSTLSVETVQRIGRAVGYRVQYNPAQWHASPEKTDEKSTKGVDSTD